VEQAEIHRLIVQEESSNEIKIVEQGSYRRNNRQNSEHKQIKKNNTDTDWKNKEGELSRQKGNNNTCNINGRKKQIINCNRCGRNHNLKECPAFGQEYKGCGLLNHFEINCRNKKSDKKTLNIITLFVDV